MVVSLILMKNFIFLIFITITSISYTQNDYLLGENYYREGEYEKATQIFTKLYSKNPFNTSYLSRLISCYQETDQFLNANITFKEIMQIKKVLKHKLSNIYHLRIEYPE